MPYVSTEKVESSNIERIGYHRKQSILRIVFKGGRAYDYPLVTERDYRALMAAESKGSFFNRRIKPMYGHRNPREVELVEPCCEHEGSDTCTTECLPCNEYCCPELSGVSQEEIAAAIKDGLAFGSLDHKRGPVESPPSQTDEEKTAKFAEAYGASPATVDRIVSGEGIQIGGDAQIGHSVVDKDSDTLAEVEKACLHPNIESLADGSNPVCAACGVDLSQSGDCSHGADGRNCEEGCGCIPCHAPQEESPEAEAHSKTLHERDDIIEEEETHGNSD